LLNKAYKYAIIYFLLFSILLLISAILIFEQKIGFSYQSVVNYYLGNSTTFTPAKTYNGILEIILPHIFTFALFIMVLLHFLLFTKQRNTKIAQIVIYTTLISGFFELSSPFFIISGFKFFAYIKIISFFLFYLSILSTIFILFKSIIYD